MKRIRGLTHLLFDAVDGTTSLVQRTHERAAEKPRKILEQIDGVSQTSELVFAAERVASRGVYATIRLVNRGVRELVDVGYKQLAPEAIERETPEPTPVLDQVQGALNGFIGDYLHERDNGFVNDMTLRHQGKAVDPESLGDVLADPTGRVVVFVHGLSCTEWQWGIYSERFYERRGVTFGKRLAEDLGFTPLFLRYNTGRHISENGQDLSALLDRIVEQYPVPIEEIALVGHSMGGLVSRSAAHYGKAHDANWITSLKHLFCIGSPHLGAPLEKATNALTSLLSQFDVAGTQVPAELLNARSAGIKDLRYGYIVDDEWLDRDPDAFWEDHRQEIPLVDHVSYYAIGSSLGGTPDHPVSQLLGDMMVRLPSAHGEHPEEHRRLHFHMKQYFPRVQHLTLMNHPDVYEQLKTWLAGTAPQLDGGPA